MYELCSSAHLVLRSGGAAGGVATVTQARAVRFTHTVSTSQGHQLSAGMYLLLHSSRTGEFLSMATVLVGQ